MPENTLFTLDSPTSFCENALADRNASNNHLKSTSYKIDLRFHTTSRPLGGTLKMKFLYNQVNVSYRRFVARSI